MGTWRSPVAYCLRRMPHNVCGWNLAVDLLHVTPDLSLYFSFLLSLPCHYNKRHKMPPKSYIYNVYLKKIDSELHPLISPY